VFSVLLIYTAMNFNTLKPAYNGTASDGIFTVGNMFRLFIFFYIFCWPCISVYLS